LQRLDRGTVSHAPGADRRRSSNAKMQLSAQASSAVSMPSGEPNVTVDVSRFGSARF
jgi:hypothetical protein